MGLLRLLPLWLRRYVVAHRVEPYTMVGPARIRSLFRLACQIERDQVPGDVVECGVCNGGTAAILAHFATRSALRRTLWLFDSFEGMPATTDRDGAAAVAYVGQVVGDISKARRALDLVDADLTRTQFVKGWFQETFPTVTIPRIALLNIDADWYDSVKLCLDTFYDAVTPGGYISIDDYGFWPGCRQAVDDFFTARRLPFSLQPVDSTARWFQKR